MSQLPGLRKLLDTPLRDTSICRGPDDTWYLTGTVEPFWAYNQGIQVWKSPDLTNWTALGFVWKYGSSPWHQPYLEKKKPLWAPEIHFLKGTFWLTYSLPGWDGTGKTSGCGLLRSSSGRAEGPYEDMHPQERLGDEIDASLFQDDDGAIYFLWHSGKIARLKPDMSGLAEPYRWLKTTATDPDLKHHSSLCAGIFGKDSFDHVGFEGMFLFKRDGRYYLACAEGFEGRYSCMIATATNLFGPYGARYEAIPHGGHNTFFRDAAGRWWSTFFGSDPKAPWRERPGVLPVEFGPEGRLGPGYSEGGRLSTPARTFYVDAERGEDQHDGLRPDTAWRSLAKVNRAPLSPGDRVLFRRGQTWRGQLRPQSGNDSKVITYDAFGEGTKPVLLGSVAADQVEQWQAAGEGIWATTPLRFETVGVQSELQQGRWWLHQEASAACTFTPEARPDGVVLRLACRSPGTQANHLQLSVPDLAVQEGEYYLFTFQAQASRPFTPTAVSLMKSAAPWTTYAATETVLPVLGTNWAEYAIRFQARQSATDARLTLFLGGTLPADTTLALRPGRLLKVQPNQAIPLAVDVGNIIFDHGQTTGVKRWSEAELLREGDYFYDTRSWQVKLRSETHPAKRYRSIELALRRHIIDQGDRAYVTYENLDLRYGAAHGIGGGSTHHITVHGCDISYIGGGHQMTGRDGKPVRFGNGIEFWSDARDSLVEDCRLWEIYDAALTNQGDGTNVQERITYRGNVIWNSEYSFEYWNRGSTSKTRDIVFERNTCVDAGYGWGHRQRPDPNGRHLMFYANTAATTNVVVRSNVFCNATDSLLRLHGPDWTAALLMDHNCWFQPRGPWLLWGQQTVGGETFGPFMHSRGLDRHSVLSDPKFMNAAQRDYRLVPESPARTVTERGDL